MDSLTLDFKLIVTLFTLGLGVFLFYKEYFRSDVTALFLMILLILTGVLTPKEAIKGFSNEATITVACMLIISSAFLHSGAITFLTKLVSRFLNKGVNAATITMSLIVGVVSAFINNTAAVAVFMPLAIRTSNQLKVDRRLILMPLSFASIFGGTCTLIGTSTNILANSIYQEKLGKSFSLFEFSVIGVILFFVGTTYLLTVGLKFLTSKKNVNFIDSNASYHTEVQILESSPSAGCIMLESPIYKDYDAQILNIKSNEGALKSFNSKIDVHDRIAMLCPIDKIKSLKDREGISILSQSATDFGSIHEIVVPGNSDLIGRSLAHLSRLSKNLIVPIALRHNGQTIVNALENHKLHAGDILLVSSSNEAILEWERSEGVVLISEIQTQAPDILKIVISSLIVLGIVLSSSIGLISILGASLIGCLLLILLKIISIEQAYDSLDSKVLVLLASVLSLGLALEKSGATKFLSKYGAEWLSHSSPFLIIAMIYLITSLMTEIMSNNATVVVMTPLAIQLSQILGFNEKPLILAVMLAGSSSFMTPIGYQTNTLIYSSGNFSFKDFIRVGAPLNFIFWILSSSLIFILFPL